VSLPPIPLSVCDRIGCRESVGKITLRRGDDMRHCDWLLLLLTESHSLRRLKGCLRLASDRRKKVQSAVQQMRFGKTRIDGGMSRRWMRLVRNSRLEWWQSIAQGEAERGRHQLETIAGQETLAVGKSDSAVQNAEQFPCPHKMGTSQCARQTMHSIRFSFAPDRTCSVVSPPI
jgi:hypothetical protein